RRVSRLAGSTTWRRPTPACSRWRWPGRPRISIAVPTCCSCTTRPSRKARRLRPARPGRPRHWDRLRPQPWSRHQASLQSIAGCGDEPATAEPVVVRRHPDGGPAVDAGATARRAGAVQAVLAGARPAVLVAGIGRSGEPRPGLRRGSVCRPAQWRAAWRTGLAPVRADLHRPSLPLAPAFFPDVAAGAGGPGAAAERSHPSADRAHAGRRLVAARQLVDLALRRCGPVAVPVPAARRPARTIADS